MNEGFFILALFLSLVLHGWTVYHLREATKVIMVLVELVHKNKTWTEEDEQKAMKKYNLK